MADYVQFVLNLVSEKPGEFMPHELVREVRRYAILAGNGDPGLAQARACVDNAMQTGIDVRDKVIVFDITAGKRCYPR